MVTTRPNDRAPGALIIDASVAPSSSGRQADLAAKSSSGRQADLAAMSSSGRQADLAAMSSSGRQADLAVALPAAGQHGKDVDLVQAMFDRVAPRYDLANAVLSFGQDAHWRRVTAKAAQPSGATCLDVASGPGNVAQALLAAGADEVIALDLSLGMLEVGKARALPSIQWIQGNALALPLADASVDAVTISFGLRNVPDAPAAIAEFARVLRPGGRLVIAEFAAPTWAPFRTIYTEYLLRLLPRIADLVSSDGRSYRYLAESIVAWPDRKTLASWIEDAGFVGVQVKDLAGGIVAMHRGSRAS